MIIPPLISYLSAVVLWGGILQQWGGCVSKPRSWNIGSHLSTGPMLLPPPIAQETLANRSQPSTRTQNRHQSLDCHIKWRPQTETQTRANSQTPMRNSGQNGSHLRVTLIRQSWTLVAIILGTQTLLVRALGFGPGCAI